MDERSGFRMNRSLGEALLPVNADVRDLDAIIIDEDDRRLTNWGSRAFWVWFASGD